jgi:acetyl-CoA carboxylase biotin carboxylase subunit
MRGHAIECRIYAEDPDNNFFPSPGTITRLATPSGPGIREDSGVYEGWKVPLEYDPLLSKLVAYAPSRPQALARMRRALDEYFIGGIKTNLGLFRRILDDKHYITGHMDTGLLDRLLASRESSSPADGEADSARIAAIGAAIFAFNGTGAKVELSPEPNGKWKRSAREQSLRNSGGQRA